VPPPPPPAAARRRRPARRLRIQAIGSYIQLARLNGQINDLQFKGNTHLNNQIIAMINSFNNRDSAVLWFGKRMLSAPD
jgi:hypothetical protein